MILRPNVWAQGRCINTSLYGSYQDYDGGNRVNSANVPRDGPDTEVPQQVLGEFVGKGVRAVHPFGVQLIRMQEIMTYNVPTPQNLWDRML